MKLLQNYNLKQLAEQLADYNLPAYKIEQLYIWLAKGETFDNMSNLSKDVRNKLKEEYIDQSVQVKQTLTGADGTEKYLFALHDGNIIEGVLMKYKYGNTLCISTQVGCRMGCTFCASTLGGLIRNLSAGEMIGEIAVVNKLHGGNTDKRAVTNVVLMGSGEPLDNYDNVIAFLKLANDEKGLNISARNISLSTCGIVDKIYDLANEKIPVNLTVSLHSPFQAKRAEIMPIAQKYEIDKVIAAAKYYFDTTKRRVIYEYTLIDGVNDSYADAKQLRALTQGYSAHINLIRLNPVKERKLRATTSDNAKKFLSTLTDMGVSATLRRQMGVDIAGACGQLRRSFLEDTDK